MSYISNGVSIHLTFCETAKHGKDMQSIGTICDSGFTNEHLLWYNNNLNQPDNVKIYNVKDSLPSTLYQIPDCYVLVIKGYFKDQSDDLLRTLLTQESSDGSSITGVNWDCHRIVNDKILENKLGYKLLFCDLGNSWKYPFSTREKRGTIYNSRMIPSLFSVQSVLEKQLGVLSVVDATYYYNINDCFTPLHQVKDRKKFVGLGLGATVPLQFKWFKDSIQCSDTTSIQIEHGDLYIISESAAGMIKEKQTKLYLKFGIGTNQSLFK